MQPAAGVSYNAFMRKTKSGSGSVGRSVIKLEPLTERYDDNKHNDVYQLLSDIIRSALSIKKNGKSDSTFAKVRNIALSGGYGTGKSSVLCRLRDDPDFQYCCGRKSKCLFISLSSLNGQGGEPPKEKEKETDQTDLIEKEIVKQLLYQGNSSISHFRRLRKTGLVKRVGLGVTFGLIIFFVLMGLGLVNKIVEFFSACLPVSPIQIAITLALFFIVACCFLIPATMHGHVRLKAVNAGSASLTWESDGDESYFDRYLDEIAYFFNSSKKQVVVFEDIDRFDNTRIFEDLKELNTILNQDPSNKGRAICFVYAVRDSIFDVADQHRAGESAESGNVSYLIAENIERANRTKFFDVIIPMVPFMSPTSAKGWISEEFQNDGIDLRLIQLLSNHVTDMRLIKNMHNEFLVFKNELTAVTEEQPGKLKLDVNRVLAIVAYKSIYPRDFEKLRMGTSCLDDIYRFKLSIVRKKRRDSQAKSTELQSCIADASGRTRASVKYGQILKEVLNALQYDNPYPYSNAIPLRIVDDGVELTRYDDENQFYTVGFWSTLSNLYETHKNMHLHTNDNAVLFSMIAGLIETATGEKLWMKKLDTAEWQEVEKLRDIIHGISYLSMQTVMEKTDWKASSTGQSAQKSLRTFVEERYGNTLGTDLIAAGFISDDYQLYAASHKDKWLSNDGINFEIHNLSQGRSEDERSLEWKLSDEDCAKVYKDFGQEITKSRDAYNVQFLDWLLDKHPDQAQNMLRSPEYYDDWDREFYTAYLTEDNADMKKRDSIVKTMSGKSDKILNFLVDCLELDDGQRRHYISIALESIREETSDGKNMDSKVRDYLLAQDTHLTCMGDDQLPEQQAKLIADYYKDARILLSKLRSLSPQMLSAVKGSRAYAVERNSFQIVFGPDCDLSLNSIRDKDGEEYSQLITGGMADYLDKVNPEITIGGDAKQYSEIVRKMLKANNQTKTTDNNRGDAIKELIERSKPSEPVTDLSAIFDLEDYNDSNKVDQLVIRTMARCQLFAPTPGNIWDFLIVLNPGDEVLEQDQCSFDELLGYMRISENDMQDTSGNVIPDQNKPYLATLILNSRQLRADVELRVELVKQLSLPNDALNAEQLDDRTSAMFAKLMDLHLISETPDTFNFLQSPKARRACIRNWDTVMEGVEIPADEIPEILSDPEVTADVKEAIYADLPRFLTETDRDNTALRKILEIAGKGNQALSLLTLKWIAERLFTRSEDGAYKYSDESLTGLIRLIAISIENQTSPDAESDDGLRSVLLAMPSDYQKLVDNSSETVYLPLNKDDFTIATTVKNQLHTIKRVSQQKQRQQIQCVKVHDLDHRA